jgi:hypothetical protein
VSQISEPPWIRSYALTPKRLTEGGWVWLRAYEWRWERPAAHLPNAVNPLRVRTRKASPPSRKSKPESDVVGGQRPA